jgi:hypothetical protein
LETFNAKHDDFHEAQPPPAPDLTQQQLLKLAEIETHLPDTSSCSEPGLIEVFSNDYQSCRNQKNFLQRDLNMMEDVPVHPKVFTDRLKIKPYFQYFPVSETRDLKKRQDSESPSMSPGHTTALHILRESKTTRMGEAVSWDGRQN